jgi:hypothetical protein
MPLTDCFCTVFDSNYLSRGLALYQSLRQWCPEGQLWILAMDRACEDALRVARLEGAVVVSLQQFETAELLKVKPSRSRQEYVWTCTPAFLYYCLTQSGVDRCTYVDPDVWFFASPHLLLDEMAVDDHILVTEHRFAPRHQHQLSTAGPFCVHFNSFRNTAHGLNALVWWRDKCLDWCYARHEGPLFGDQRYLDDWPTRFSGVRIAAHAGAGLGPWNVEAYDIGPESPTPKIRRTGAEHWSPLVFYHYHAVQFFSDGRVTLADGYRIPRQAIDRLYRPYLRALVAAKSSVDSQLNANGVRRLTLADRLKQFVAGLLGRHSTVRVPNLNQTQR